MGGRPAARMGVANSVAPMPAAAARKERLEMPKCWYARMNGPVSNPAEVPDRRSGFGRTLLSGRIVPQHEDGVNRAWA